jgi:hypothetical protein
VPVLDLSVRALLRVTAGGGQQGGHKERGEAREYRTPDLHPLEAGLAAGVDARQDVIPSG